MTTPQVVDDRPRCTSEGDYFGQPVPCDLHDGHKGKHQWSKPMTFEEYEWTDSRPRVKP